MYELITRQLVLGNGLGQTIYMPAVLAQMTQILCMHGGGRALSDFSKQTGWGMTSQCSTAWRMHSRQQRLGTLRSMLTTMTPSAGMLELLPVRHKLDERYALLRKASKRIDLLSQQMLHSASCMDTAYYCSRCCTVPHAWTLPHAGAIVYL